jgi:hypothetical protein
MFEVDVNPYVSFAVQPLDEETGMKNAFPIITDQNDSFAPLHWVVSRYCLRKQQMT